MSQGPSPTPGSPSGRRPRNAVVAVALLVLVLVVVLAGLLRGGDGTADGGAGGTGTSATSSSASSRPSSSSRPPSAGRPSSPSTAGTRDPESGLRVVTLSSLPREAQTTVRLIDAGGPFPYAKDGVTFSNRERVLPRHPSGWYREYTVTTPGEGDRGARRIVTGDDDRLLFYTADHYRTFVSVAR